MSTPERKKGIRRGRRPAVGAPAVGNIEEGDQPPRHKDKKGGKGIIR
jgi:hypothetical protein